MNSKLWLNQVVDHQWSAKRSAVNDLPSAWQVNRADGHVTDSIGSHARRLWALNERGQGQLLDVAGGYGILTRMLRDIGFNCYWADKYCANLMAPGFEYRPELGACRAVTAIEVLEHLTDPVAFIEEALATSGAQTLLFTTELYEGPPPDPAAWWYYSFGTGQHIGFFQRRTLQALGARLGLHLASANGLHVLSKERVSERVLALATGRLASRLGPWWIRRRLGSRTMSDHNLLLRGRA